MRTCVFLVAASVAPAFFASAAGTKRPEAQLTQVVNSVQLLAGHAEPQPAKPNDELREGAEVHTGADSRAEITFRDQTIARLGGNTLFGFERGASNLRLNEGIVLVQAPGGLRGAKIETDGVTAGVKAATAVFEYHPSVFKFMVLQGTGRLYRPGHLGESVLVRAGQMVIGNPKTALSDPVDFDLGRFAKTCRFLIDFAPLRSAQSIARESEKQQHSKSKKVLIDTNLVIYGAGSVVSLTEEPGPSESDDHKSEETSAVPRPVPASVAMPRLDRTTTEIPR
jgi:mannose-6-phosphate isomerase-like protein (cupin superfamily)